MSDFRLVIDTGVVVSAALFSPSVPNALVKWALKNGIILISRETMDELSKVIQREKFDRYAPRQTRLEFLWAFYEKSHPVEIQTRTDACRDPKDNIYLDVALNGDASHLVTGDNDLLVLHPFQGIPILRPAAFLDSIKPR
jgi:putative PIN family toxin of toxin-antitoxin system